MRRTPSHWLWFIAAILATGTLAFVLWPEFGSTPQGESTSSESVAVEAPLSELAEAGPELMHGKGATQDPTAEAARVRKESQDAPLAESQLVIPSGYGVVRLQVVDATTGVGIAGIRVRCAPDYERSLAGGPWYRRTGADGWIDLPLPINTAGVLRAGGERDSRYPPTVDAEGLPPGLRYSNNLIEVPGVQAGEIQDARLELQPAQLYTWLRVVDGQTGAALTGVQLSADSSPCATLRDDGLWRVALLPKAHRYGVQVKAQGYGDAVVNPGAWPMMPSQALVVELYPPGYLDLRVLRSGQPVEGASVQLFRGSEQWEFVTDARGEIHAELGASPPAYALRVHAAAGRMDELGDLFIEAGRRTERVHDLASKVTVAGYVRTENGAGVPNAWVALRPLNGAFRGWNCETNSDGSFSQAGLIEGPYTIVSGYTTAQGLVYRSAAQQIYVSKSGQTDLDLRPKQETGFALRCKFDAEQALDLTLTAIGGSYSTVSLGPVKSGELIQRDGYLPGERVSLRVASRDGKWVMARPLDVQASAGAIYEIELEAARTLLGMTVDESGQPIAAEILLRVSESGGREPQPIRSKADGSFELTALGSADYHIIARSQDGRVGALQISSAEVAAGESIQVVLAPAAWLRVNTSERARRYELDVWSRGQSVAHVYLDVASVGVLVPPGRLRLVVTDGGQTVRELVVEVAAGASETVNL